MTTELVIQVLVAIISFIGVLYATNKGSEEKHLKKVKSLQKNY